MANPHYLGTRPRHPERPSIFHLALFPEIAPLHLLRLYLHLGLRRDLPRPLSTIHVLPHYGRRSLQPVHPISSPPPPFPKF